MDDDEKEKSILESVDTEGLIEEVKKRPALWDNHNKDYNDPAARKRAWNDLFITFFPDYEDLDGFTKMTIANEIQARWNNLRCAYTRYLRELKNIQYGLKKRKKKYIYADAMCFIDENINPKRFVIWKRQPGNNTQIKTVTETDAVSTDDVDNRAMKNHHQKSSDCLEDEIDEVSCTGKPGKGLKEVVVSPRTEKRRIPGEDPLMSFFRSLVPDTRVLSAKRKRMFKARVLEILNELMDDQENESVDTTSQFSEGVSYSVVKEEEELQQNSVDHMLYSIT